MDRSVPPRVAYWTSSFRPEMEAVAAEVALLRRAFPGSVVWGVSQRDGFCCSWRRGFAVSPQFALPFFALSRIAQCAFHVNHVFGGLGDWFHLRAISKQPTILTLAVHASIHDTRLLQRVDRFVVEWPAAEQQLQALGVAKERIDLVLPPVDLTRFAPSPPPAAPFTVLFVSSPDRKDWLCARGIDLLLDTARLRPHFRFILLWRPWGDSASEVRRMIEQRQLHNVELRIERVADMRAVYAAGHVTVAPFRELEKCKPAPNSIAESLACGRPVVVTREVGFAEMVDSAKAGRVTLDDPDDFAMQLDRIETDWQAYSASARWLAEQRLGVPQFLDAYRRVYAAVM